MRYCVLLLQKNLNFADIEHIGKYREDNTYNQKHIDSVLALKLVDVEAIRKAKFPRGN